MARYSLELDLQDPWLCPFAIYAKPDSASCVRREACVVEATGGFDSLSHHLHLGVGEWRHVMSQEVDAGLAGSCLVGIQQFLNAREHHLGDWCPIFVVHESIE